MMAVIRPRTLLVLGGARSGKSRYGRGLIESCGLEPVLIATATAGDEEMRERIARHRAERGAGWTSIEEPLALVETLARETAPGRAILVDCLTLWLANVMLAGLDWEAQAERLVAAIGATRGPLVLVSNEVGQGIVPETPLGRAFRDAQGWLNQAVAGACDGVVLVTAGLPALAKPAPMPVISLE